MRSSTLTLAVSALMFTVLYCITTIITSNGPFLHLDAGAHGIALAAIASIIAYGSYIVAAEICGQAEALYGNSSVRIVNLND